MVIETKTYLKLKKINPTNKTYLAKNSAIELKKEEEDLESSTLL